MAISYSYFINLGLQKSKAHEHREHGAHVHGGATLAVAFDGFNGKIEFKAAADGVLGFETEPQSEAQKKVYHDVVEKFERDIGKMIVFDRRLGCMISKDKIERVADIPEPAAAPTKGKKAKAAPTAQHSDFIANFNVICGLAIDGSVIKFDFSGFSHLKDIDVTVLSGNIQKSAELKGKPLSLEIR